MGTALAGMLALAAAQTRGPAAGGDWPGWRGPDRNAISADTGLLKTWPEGGPPLLWKASGIGPGFSSVAIAGDIERANFAPVWQ